MRRLLRRLVRTVAVTLVLAVVAEFFIVLGHEWRWYQKPSQRLGAVMSTLSSIVNQPWFIGLTIFFAGLAIGTRLDLLLGRRDRRRREDPVLVREILRFIDVCAIPALKYWHDGLTCMKNWKDNENFPRDTIIAYMCFMADLDMQAVRIWAEQARANDEPMTAYELQHLVCNVHRALLRVFYLNQLYKTLDPPGWVVENLIARHEVMSKYHSGLEDLARDSRCTIIRQFVNEHDKYL